MAWTVYISTNQGKYYVSENGDCTQCIELSRLFPTKQAADNYKLELDQALKDNEDLQGFLGLIIYAHHVIQI